MQTFCAKPFSLDTFPNLIRGCREKHMAQMVIVSLLMAMMGRAHAVHVGGKFVVQLCEEKHRAKVSRHVTDRHAAEDAPHFEASVRRHYGNLAKLPAFSISGASNGAAAAMNIGLFSHWPQRERERERASERENDALSYTLQRERERERERAQLLSNARRRRRGAPGLA